MLHSMLGWNIDLLYHQPDGAAFGRVPCHHPSARIVDIEVVKEKPVANSAILHDNAAHRLAAQDGYAARTICVNASSFGSKARSAAATANDVAWRAWLRAQRDDAEASRMENCIRHLDVYV